MTKPILVFRRGCPLLLYLLIPPYFLTASFSFVLTAVSLLESFLFSSDGSKLGGSFREVGSRKWLTVAREFDFTRRSWKLIVFLNL